MKKLNIRALIVAILTIVLSVFFVTAGAQEAVRPGPWSKTDSSPSATLTGTGDTIGKSLWPKTDSSESAVMTGYATPAQITDQNETPLAKTLSGTPESAGAILVGDDDSDGQLLVGAPDAIQPGDKIQVNDKMYEVSDTQTSATLSPIQ